MKSIVCFKIAQRKLPQDGKTSSEKHGFDYFPFDRGYLIPPDATQYIPRLFRVYMLMDLTSPLLAALNELSFARVFHDTIQRNVNAPQQGKSRDALNGLCDTPQGWKLVIPTFLQNAYSVEKRKYVSASVRYILSVIIGTGHNAQAALPGITLVAPHYTYPLICVACLRLPEQLAGNCTFGTAECRNSKDFELPVDTLTKVPEEKEHDGIQ
jgi:hypothetical protein